MSTVPFLELVRKTEPEINWPDYPRIVPGEHLASRRSASECDGPDPICGDDPYPRYPEAHYDVMAVAAVIYQDPRFRARYGWPGPANVEMPRRLPAALGPVASLRFL